MACTEHVQSVDPRYLDLPNYDFEYTRAARERPVVDPVQSNPPAGTQPPFPDAFRRTRRNKHEQEGQ